MEAEAGDIKNDTMSLTDETIVLMYEIKGQILILEQYSFKLKKKATRS